MHPAIALGIAYVAGSLPFAYLAGRVLKGVDLRTVGSGNLGATNVYRTLGVPAAAVVLLLDALKGGLPVALLPRALDSSVLAGSSAPLWWSLAFGVAAIAGHAKPVFLLWKGGGKGVATAAGVFAAVAPVALAISLSLFVLVVWRTRFVSLGSIVAAAVLPLSVALTAGLQSPLFVVACAVAAFVVWSHRANIQRLRAGTESRIGRPTEATR
ncbi:MAG: glycerol-3-phosphate 1-O-acyltransferase PlsY [Gemmatimonadaceae bacterium]